MEKKETIKSVTFILSGMMLQMFNGIGSGWASTLTAIFGIILLFMGLTKLKQGLDEAGKSAVKLIIIAIVIGVVGLILSLIPLMGLVIAPIIFIVAFIVELIGIIKLKKSDTIGDVGKSGVTLLLVAMILAILDSIFSFIPLAGGIIGAILSLVALILVFFGWIRVQDGIISDKSE
ncbi:MAG: hypothetical protein R6T99_11435 [Bacteroidales bacterium]